MIVSSFVDGARAAVCAIALWLQDNRHEDTLHIISCFHDAISSKTDFLSSEKSLASLLSPLRTGMLQDRTVPVPYNESPGGPGGLS